MQAWDLNLILRLQQALRSPIFDWFFYIISFLGDEYFFLVVSVVLYWCVSKRFAYRFFNVFMMGALFTGVIKTIVARPRPYLNGAESVISKTEGFSFPSGHSQSAANMCVQLSLAAKGNFRRKTAVITIVVSASLALLVMFSRMYLGQHYLSDVLVGALLGAGVAVLFTFLFRLLGQRDRLLFVVILPISVIAAAILIGLGQNPGDIIKLLGVAGAMSLGYYLENRFVSYNVKSGGMLKQVLKVIIGAVIVLAIKEGLKAIFSATGAEGRLLILMDFFRYFLMGIAAAYLVPMLFKRVRL
jgi:undecaprenyl-diphosphatase